jgi:predicted AAA+ superfamily ATPase
MTSPTTAVPPLDQTPLFALSANNTTSDYVREVSTKAATLSYALELVERIQREEEVFIQEFAEALQQAAGDRCTLADLGKFIKRIGDEISEIQALQELLYNNGFENAFNFLVKLETRMNYESTHVRQTFPPELFS